MSRAMTSDEIEQQIREYHKMGLEQFPVNLIEVTGDEALEDGNRP